MPILTKSARRRGKRAVVDAATFRYRSLADALRRRIERGHSEVGFKLPPLRTIASEYGVSLVTVNRAIKTLEEERRIYRVAGTGVFVRPAGRTASRQLLTLAVSDAGAAFELGVVKGIERACAERGWRMMMLDARSDPAMERRNFEQLRSEGSQGAIVLASGYRPNVDVLSAQRTSAFPLVMVDHLPCGFKADCVRSDHEMGGCQATRHLLGSGHKQVLLLGGDFTKPSARAIIYGYERALREAGIEQRPGWNVHVDGEIYAHGLATGKKWLGGQRAILPRLRALQRPIGVLALDGYLAWGIYEACRELGLRIPRDVSIVGFDDSELACALRPALTVVSQRTEEIGRAAVDLLVKRVTTAAAEKQSPSSYRHQVVAVDLTVRGSVDRKTAGVHSSAKEATCFSA